jgi:hypothetical protein
VLYCIHGVPQAQALYLGYQLADLFIEVGKANAFEFVYPNVVYSYRTAVYTSVGGTLNNSTSNRVAGCRPPFSRVPFGLWQWSVAGQLKQTNDWFERESTWMIGGCDCRRTLHSAAAPARLFCKVCQEASGVC